MGKIMITRLTWLLLTCLMLSQSPLLAADATITVTKEQGGREIALKVGNILLIELPGKGGTGFSWVVEATGAPYLKLMSEATQKVGEPRPGGPVMQVWRFKAAQPGTTELKMAYYRPWEGVGKAVDHFRVKLHIE
jgi:predicted secreted protein